MVPMAANEYKKWVRDSNPEENEFEGFLASDLLICAMRTSVLILRVTMSQACPIFCLVVMRNSQTAVVMTKCLL